MSIDFSCVIEIISLLINTHTTHTNERYLNANPASIATNATLSRHANHLPTHDSLIKAAKQRLNLVSVTGWLIKIIPFTPPVRYIKHAGSGESQELAAATEQGQCQQGKGGAGVGSVSEEEKVIKQFTVLEIVARIQTQTSKNNPPFRAFGIRWSERMGYKISTPKQNASSLDGSTTTDNKGHSPVTGARQELDTFNRAVAPSTKTL